MKTPTFFRWSLLVVANVAGLCVLSFYQATDAAPRKTPEPFANAVTQRYEMLVELRKTNRLLAEQNALLRSGKLHVIAEHPPNKNLDP